MALPAGEGSHMEGMGRRHPRWATHRRSPTGRDRLKQMRVKMPRADRTGLASPMPEDLLIPPVVSASSESLEEEPQRIPNYSSTTGNQCLPSAQPSAPVGRTPTLEDRQAEE